MQASHFWNQFNLYRYKVVLVASLMVGACGSLAAQSYMWAQKNNPNYDNRRLTYGFLIGVHSSAYKVRYSDKFVTPEFDTLYSVEPSWKGGFSLGFIVNYKLADFFDLRLTPIVAFYEHSLTYRYTDDQAPRQENVETTMVEFPILLKYKSERRGNVRMYMIGGIKPALEASGKKKEENVTNALEVKGANLSADFGFGFDFYYPLFKFSPEIRFSKGLVDILDNRQAPLGQPLQRVTTNTITVYFLFQ